MAKVSELKVGDKVSVSGTVESLSAHTEEGKNVSLRLADGSEVSVNSSQVSVAKAEEPKIEEQKAKPAPVPVGQVPPAV